MPRLFGNYGVPYVCVGAWRAVRYLGGLTEKERKNLDKTSELRLSKEALVQYINERKPRILEI